MKKTAHEQYDELASQSVLKRTLHSIRTRYSLATAFLILLCLAVFYIGGRIVLVHMMREAERQVEEIGYDISRLAYSHADTVVKENRGSAVEIARLVANGVPVSRALLRPEFSSLSLVLSFSKSGVFSSGAARGAGGVVTVSPADVSPYVERLSECLEHAFNDMMVIFTGEYPEMKVHGCGIGNGVEKLPDQLSIEFSHRRCSKSFFLPLEVHAEIRSSGKIDRTKDKGFVHGKNEITEAADPGFISHSLFDGLSQDYAGVFHQMMAVHLQIARCLNLEIKESVAGKCVQHMIKKADSCSVSQIRFTFSVNLQTDADLRLTGIPSDNGISH